MNTHSDKTQENKSQSVANALSCKNNVGESAFQLVDNRPEAIRMRKLKELSNNNSNKMQVAQLQPMTSAERRAYRDHVFNMGIRDIPVENPAGYHEQRSTIGGLSSYPHGSPSSAATPGHVTDLRRDNTVAGYAQLEGPPGGPYVAATQTYTVHERFHRHIVGGAVGGIIHDRYVASVVNSRPNSSLGYELFATLVDPDAQTVTIIVPVGGAGAHPLISPRTQAR